MAAARSNTSSPRARPDKSREQPQHRPDPSDPSWPYRKPYAQIQSDPGSSPSAANCREHEPAPHRRSVRQCQPAGLAGRGERNGCSVTPGARSVWDRSSSLPASRGWWPGREALNWKAITPCGPATTARPEGSGLMCHSGEPTRGWCASPVLGSHWTREQVYPHDRMIVRPPVCWVATSLSEVLSGCLNRACASSEPSAASHICRLANSPAAAATAALLQVPE